MGQGTARERLLTPREFCRAVPWPLIGELSDGDEVVCCYLIIEARRLEARNSKPYLRLTLGDRTGTIDAFVWEEVERWEPVCLVDAVVGVRGRVASYQDRLQLKVQSVEPMEVEPADYEHLVAASPRPRGEMKRDLDDLVASVEDSGLRALLLRCVGPDGDTGRDYRSHPAAMRNHHAYVGGLMEHSISVALACDGLVRHYATQGVDLDRDLLVSAALLHDIGKLRELRGPPASGYTTEGRLLGHIVIGMQMVEAEAAHLADLHPDRLLLLQHLIASHQGRPEWDSPRTPQMLEALILHYADDLDAKMNAAGRLIQGVEAGEWTAYDRSLERSFYRPAHRSHGDSRRPSSAAALPATRTVGEEVDGDEVTAEGGRGMREENPSARGQDEPIFDLFDDRPPE